MRVLKIRTFVACFICLGVIVGLAFVWHIGYTRYMRAAYPLKYRAQVEQYAAQSDVSPSLVYAVIKSESGFNPNAVSRIGARGLMQLTPETFWWVQGNSNPSTLSDDALFDPAVNIRYGTLVLKRLLQEFGREDTALAAYHAGRANVKKWLKDSRYSTDGHTISHIPFADTRAYVKRVIETQNTYAALYHIE